MPVPPARYALLEVPDYMATGKSGATGATVNSYLCLGQPGDALPGYGEDLATVVTDFADDQRAREPSGATNLPCAESYPGSAGFEQGLDPSLPAPAANGLDASGRSAESDILHTKGGWRDHTDGNRVTTTRGDKVEVIRGNYRMVVLGRRDPGGTTAGAAAQPSPHVVDPTTSGTMSTGLDGYISEQAGDTPGTIAPGAGTTPPPPPSDLTNGVSMDISGGLVDIETYLATDPGTSRDQTALSTEYVWSQDSNGLWGWTQRTQAGVYFNDPKNGPRTPPGNGKTISYTWVDEIWAFRGSPNPDPFVAPGFDPVTQKSVGPDTWDTTNPNNTVSQPVKKLWSADWAELFHDEANATAIAGSTATPRLETTQSSAGTLQSDTVSSGDMLLNSQTTDGGNLTTTTVSSSDLTNTLSSSGHLTNVTTTTDSITESFVSHGYHQVTDKSEGAITSEALAVGAIAGLNAAGLVVGQANLAVGMVSSFEIALMLSEVHIGLVQFEQRIGMHQNTHLGVHADNHMVMHQDVHMGVHNEVHVGPHNQFATMKTNNHEMLIQTANIFAYAATKQNFGIPGTPAPPPAALNLTPTPLPPGVVPEIDPSIIGGDFGMLPGVAGTAGSGAAFSSDYILSGVISAAGLAFLGYETFTSQPTSSPSASAPAQGTSSKKPGS